MPRQDPALRVGVVIPFYQRRSGLLIDAVRSALGQTGVLPPAILVVDDQSPLSAADELIGLTEVERTHVTIITQPNGGPGAARNKGLDALPADIEAVAFLDSDDRWTPGHLANAAAAIAAGADLYFTDYIPLASDRSTFEICDLRPEAAARIESGSNIFRFPGDLFDALLKRSPVGTSTVVYRRSAAADVRFPTGFHFGEDVYFWMTLATRARLVMYSTDQEAVYGSGVNIAAGATWGTPHQLRRDYHDFAFHKAIARGFPLTAGQRTWNDRWMTEMARSFAANLLHLLRRGGQVEWPIVWRFLLSRPILPLDLISVARAAWSRD